MRRSGNGPTRRLNVADVVHRDSTVALRLYLHQLLSNDIC
jgi:hypothetical protein